LIISNSRIFIFGNSLPNIYMHNLSCMFPRLVSFYSEIFDYEGCNFTEKNMHQADKSDGLSKDGAGRVALYKATNLVHSYTLECNYNTGRITNILHDITYLQPAEISKTYGRQGVDLDIACNAPFYNTKPDTYFYKISDFQGVGVALVNAFLDLNLLNV
jgi:cytosolic carboxypeptidase protein 5